MVQGAAVVLDAAALPQAGGLATAPLNAQDAEAVVADPRLAALAALKGAASTDADPTQPMARMAAGQTQLPQHAAAVQVHAATAQQLQGVDLTPVNPATLAAQAVASLNATDALATQAAALSLSSDTPSGAAALSLQLQEFNAMVAAARATSGTSLPPLGGFAEAAGPSLAPQPLVGLMPAGLIPGQSFAPTAPAGISAPLSSPQWPSELGRQFISIAQAAKGVGQIAELRLDPPELGPLRITINLNDNVAHAVFSSPHALVRQTVENALPQLQQMLEQAGISLGQANVNDQHQSGQASQDGSSSGGAPGRQAGTGVAAEGTEMAAGREGRSANPDALVDTFA